MSARPAPRRQPKPALLLLVLIIGAWALRVHSLDVQSLWYDEGVTTQVARLGMRELVRWTADDIQPPLYYLVVGGWLRLLDPWAGPLAYVLRFISAAFGVLLAPLLWALGRRLWDEQAGILAALVVACSPLMVYYGQEARMYTLLVTLAAAEAFVVVRWVGRSVGRHPSATTRGESKVGGVYAGLGLAALYTHYFASFVLLALALYWLYRWLLGGRQRRPLLIFLAANAVIVLGYLPWLPAMLGRFRTDSSYWAGALKVGEAILHVALNFSAGATEVMLERDARAWLVAFIVASLVWALALWPRRSGGMQRPLAFLTLWGLLPIALVLLLSYRTPKFNTRYLLISWPAWALFIAGGLSSLWAPGLGRDAERQDFGSWMSYTLSRLLFFSTLLLALGAQIVGLANWFTNPNFAKAAWRDAIAEMYFHRQPDEVALLVSGHAYPVFDAYVPADLGVPRYRLPEIEILDVNQIIGWEEAAAALNHDLAGKGGVWLFLWQNDVVDPAHVVTTLLDRYADPLATPSFPYIGLRHYRLRPHQPFPTRPPIAQPGADLGGLLQLTGIEPAAGGMWLYWRALRPDLPDLQTAITVRDTAGALLLQQDQRPAGYDFPTTRWQVGETYPAWVRTEAGEPAQINIRLYRTPETEPLGEVQLVLP